MKSTQAEFLIKPNDLEIRSSNFRTGPAQAENPAVRFPSHWAFELRREAPLHEAHQHGTPLGHTGVHGNTKMGFDRSMSSTRKKVSPTSVQTATQFSFP
jgi:hypothetical protein